MRTRETAHVLDAAEHADVGRTQEVDELACVEMRDVLWADNDEASVKRDLAEQLLLQVRRSGRQVDEQHVEGAPPDPVDELP